jgi:hypothetical protein
MYWFLQLPPQRNITHFYPRFLRKTRKIGTVGDPASGITCTALVQDTLGKPEAHATVSVKTDGKVVWSQEQNIAMSE